MVITEQYLRMVRQGLERPTLLQEEQKDITIEVSFPEQSLTFSTKSLREIPLPIK